VQALPVGMHAMVMAQLLHLRVAVQVQMLTSTLSSVQFRPTWYCRDDIK
jgi:hypothetical protein